MLQVQLDGPDFPGVEVPRDRLRPVEPADDRLVYGNHDANLTVPDGGGAGSAATATMPVVGYTGETVVALELLYEVSSPHWDQIQVDLETPGGTRVTIRKAGSSFNTPDQFLQLTIPASAKGTTPGTLGTLLGGPANGTWKLHVYDVTANGGTSTLFFTRLTLHTAGGPDQIARTASWVSPVQDFGTSVCDIKSITWDERLPDGATLSVSVRSCQQSDCSDGTWSAAVAQATPITIDPARYLQLRAVMTSNGTLEPELHSLKVLCR